jgi:hypothetical protein
MSEDDGQSYGVICLQCEHRFQVNGGGGFTSHLLRCDQCERKRSVGFAELGDLHAGYLKWLGGSYAVATGAGTRALGTPSGPPDPRD